MTRKASPVRITHADGSVTVQPAYDGPSLRLIITRPRYTPAEAAVLLYACPKCDARRGRACRSGGKPTKPHRARLALLKKPKR